MIHVSKLFEMVQFHKIFSIEWVSERGCIEAVDDASCTSWHSEGETFNIIFANERHKLGELMTQASVKAAASMIHTIEAHSIAKPRGT